MFLSSKERRRSSPKFVVTLHGALDSRIKEQRKRKHHLSKDDYDHPMFVDLHPKEPLEILESAQKEIEKMAHQLDLMQNIVPTNTNDPFNILLPGSTTLPALSSALTSVTRPVFQEALPVLPGNNGLMLSSVNPTQQVFTGVLPLQTPVMMVPKPQDKPVFAGNKQLGREIVIPLHDEKDEVMYEDDEGLSLNIICYFHKTKPTLLKWFMPLAVSTLQPKALSLTPSIIRVSSLLPSEKSQFLTGIRYSCNLQILRRAFLI